MVQHHTADPWTRVTTAHGLPADEVISAFQKETSICQSSFGKFHLHLVYTQPALACSKSEKKMFK